MKCRVEQSLKENNDIINSKPSEKSYLIDFIFCLLEIMQIAMTLRSAKEGFIANSMIDKSTSAYLEQSKNNQNNQEILTLLQLKIINDFKMIQTLRNEFYELDRILETAFDKQGILRDNLDENKSAKKQRVRACLMLAIVVT